MAAKEVKYRITGPQSISRLEPLLAGMRGITCVPSTSSTEPLDFVWETTCKAVERQQHVDATVLNRLHNSQVIEDKANLAFLQLSVATCARHCLTTYVAAGRADVAAWAERQWPTTTTTTTTTTVFTAATAAAAAAQPPTAEWWFVKASKGNGGKDIWIMNATNFRDVVAELPTTGTDDYVIQRYAPDPMLWDGKKFHFRVYAAMRADASAWLYHRAFVLTAGVAHDSAAPGDVNKHVSNLSINKHIRGHPGQIPVDLARDHAALFEEMQAMWGAVVAAADPHMATQRRPGHFEFFGLDVVADTAGGCWLIEANRLPGLESSKNNQVEEDAMYDEMMAAWLRIVLRPVVDLAAATEATHASGACDGADADGAAALREWYSDDGLWVQVRGPSSAVRYDPAGVWRNLFSWKAYTRKRRAHVMVP